MLVVVHGEKRGAENRRGRKEDSLNDFRGRERREERRQQTLEPDALEDEVVSTILDSGLADSRYERSAQTEERVRGSAKRAGPRREKGKQAASNPFFSFLPLRRCVVVPPTIADTPRKQDSRPQLEDVRL